MPSSSEVRFLLLGVLVLAACGPEAVGDCRDPALAAECQGAIPFGGGRVGPAGSDGGTLLFDGGSGTGDGGTDAGIGLDAGMDAGVDAGIGTGFDAGP